MKIPSGSAETIAQSEEAWRHCEGMEEATLLRLAILRDLMRALHAEKSKYLATGKKDEVQLLKEWELRINDLRGSSTLDGELMDLVSDPTQKPKARTRLLPEALFSSIDREKLERFDRIWESTLAAEASQDGWQFWTFDAWIDVGSVEEWSRKLTEKLWPHGIVLYVESATTPKGLSGEDSVAMVTQKVADADVTLWRGNWVVILHPKFKSPEELVGSSVHWLSTPFPPPSSARWKLLFSPRKR